MGKTKLEKHLEELGENTSGGAHDSITASGKGLAWIRELIKGSKKDEEDRLEDEEEDEEDMDDDEDEDEDGKSTKKSRRAKKNEANGGELEEEDDDEDDPGQEGEEEIITNHGKRVKGTGAVKKNARFDERRFEKSFDDFEDEHADVLDASEALADLSKHVRSMAKSTNAGMTELREQNVLLGKAVRELLKSNVSLAADLELVKKQPVGNPAPGFVVLNKSDANGRGRRLSKSDIQDAVTDAMNEGLVDSRVLSSLRTLNTEAELSNYVNNLPASVRDRL